MNGLGWIRRDLMTGLGFLVLPRVIEYDGIVSVCVQTSEDVAEYNIMSMLHEILHREKYCPSSEGEAEAKESEDKENEDKENEVQSETKEEKAKQDTAKEIGAIDAEQDRINETRTDDPKTMESEAKETKNEAKGAQESKVEAAGTQEPEAKPKTTGKAGDKSRLPTALGHCNQ